jgi:hypothetical protein
VRVLAAAAAIDGHGWQLVLLAHHFVASGGIKFADTKELGTWLPYYCQNHVASITSLTQADTLLGNKVTK